MSKLVTPVDAAGRPVSPYLYFPVAVNYRKIEAIAEAMMRNHWTDLEVQLEKDVVPFQQMEPALRDLVLGVTAFLAVGECDISDALFAFIRRIKSIVLRSAYYTQIEQEQVHNRFYQRALFYFVPDDAERERLIAGATHSDRYPSVARKMDWFNGEMNDPNASEERKFCVLLAMEGIGFGASFAIIFELRDRGHILQFATGNEWVIRDENKHSELHSTTISDLLIPGSRPSRKEIIGVFDRMLQLELDFYDEILPRPVFSLNHESMKLHLESIANFWLVAAGYEPHWSCLKTPLNSWKGAVLVKTNFFEAVNTAYSKPSLGLLADSSGRPMMDEDDD